MHTGFSSNNGHLTELTEPEMVEAELCRLDYSYMQLLSLFSPFLTTK